jgi:hypothetical protein
MSFHLSLITLEYHRVCPKQLLSLWYVWRKLCTNLAMTLTSSPNGSKQDLTWPTSPRGSFECVQNDSSLWYIQRKPCTNLASRLALSPNGPKRASTWASSPRTTMGASKMFSKLMIHSVQTVHLSCIKISTISKRTKTSFHLSLVT